MKKPLMLRVRPNPYHTLDGNGMPAGIVRVDPEVGRPGVVEFVGVVVRKVNVKGEITKGDLNEKREPMHRRRTTTLEWAQGAVEIAATGYHIDAVRSGALFADDKATAQACRIWFEPLAVQVAQAKQRAIAEWQASHGEEPPVKEWDAAVGPVAAPVVVAKATDELPLLRPWDAPIEPGTAPAKVK